MQDTLFTHTPPLHASLSLILHVSNLVPPSHEVKEGRRAELRYSYENISSHFLPQNPKLPTHSPNLEKIHLSQP